MTRLKNIFSKKSESASGAHDVRWSTLMRDAQKGDEKSYGELLKELYPYIRSIILKRLGALGTDDEFVQECILALHKSRHTYDPSKPFRPWISAVVRYKCIDLLRKKQRHWSREVIDQERLVTIPAEDTNHNKDEAVQAMTAALDVLKPEMRRAVVLTRLEGYSTQEAAQKEGISETALRARVSRAYKQLRKHLEKRIE